MAFSVWKLKLARGNTTFDPIDEPPPPPPPPPPDPLEITILTAYTRQEGQPLDIVLTAKGGKTPYEWSITADDVGIYKDFTEGNVLDWVDNNQADGIYTPTVSVTDAEGTIQSRTLTITVTPVITVNPPGPITSLAITAINPTIARVGFTAPATGGAVTGYRYSVAGGNAISLPANMRIILPEGTTNNVLVWAYNADGAGPASTVSVTTPDGGLPLDQESAVARAFDETNNTTYTFANVAVGAGQSDKVLCITVFLQGTAVQAAALTMVGNGSATQRVTTGNGNNHISMWTIPWGAGKPATNSITFNSVGSDGTTAVSAIRAAIEVRALFGREEVPVATGTDTTADGNGELHSTVASIAAERLLVFASSTTDNTDELLPDLFGVNKEPNSEGQGSQSALQYVTGTYIPSDAATNYDVGVEWVNESTGADDGGVLPRHLYAVFAEKTIAPPGGVATEWCDNFVEALAVNLHTDDSRDSADVNQMWNWPTGLAGPYGVLGSANNPKAKNLPHFTGQMGIRYWRSAWIQGTVANITNLGHEAGQNARYMEYLYKKCGMRMYGPVHRIQDGTAAEVADRTEKSIEAFYKPTLTPPWVPMYGVEGVNEYNSDKSPWYPNNALGAQRAYECQVAMYNKLLEKGKLWNGATGVLCIMCSTWKRLIDAYEALAARGTNGARIWNFSTHGVIHIYNGGREPTLTADGEGGTAGSTPQPCEISFHDAQICGQQLPVMITEVGFKYAQPEQTNVSPRPSLKRFTMPTTGNWNQLYGYNNISWYSAAKYFPRVLLEYYTKGKGINNVSIQAGHVPTGFAWQIGNTPGSLAIYNLFDDVDTRPFANWGIAYTNANKSAVIGKPSYYAIVRIVNLLKDKTWRDESYGTTAAQIAKRRTWEGTAPAVDALNYTITGANAKTGPIIQNQGRPGWVSKKSNGRYYLCLWQRETSWLNADAAPNAPERWTQAQVNALPDIESWEKLPLRDTGPNTYEDDKDFRKAMTINFLNGDGTAPRVFSTINVYEPSLGNNTNQAQYGTNGLADDTSLVATPRKVFTNVSSCAVQVPDHVMFLELIP